MVTQRWVRKYTITEEGMKFLKDNGFIDENGKWTKKFDEYGIREVKDVE